MQLPDQGKPGHKDDEKGQIVSYDATVLDWTWNGTPRMTEKESTIDNPKYKSPRPGPASTDPFEADDRESGVASFNAPFRETGACSHRAMWARHGWSRFTWMIMGSERPDNARPGENGRWSLCPENAGRKYYNIHFIKLPITLAKKQGKEPQWSIQPG